MMFELSVHGILQCFVVFTAAGMGWTLGGFAMNGVLSIFRRA